MATSVAPPAAKRELFDPEHEDFRDSVRRFIADEVSPHHAEWERAQIVPRELFTKLAGYGFLAMEVPEAYGGPGVEDWRFNVVISEEASRSGVGDALIGPLLHTDVCLPYLIASCTDEQRERWLPGRGERRADPRDRDDRARHGLGPIRDRHPRATGRRRVGAERRRRRSSPTACCRTS